MSETNIIGATEQNRYYPYQSSFRVTRQSFWQAGQDSFTNPPAQNPDMFQALSNIEPVLSGNLKRRRGYSLFYNTAVSPPVQHAYSFRSETLGIRKLVFTTPSTVFATDEAGAITDNPIFVPTLTTNGARMVLSRSYGYFSDGVRADYLKWDGTENTLNTTNWGITINQTAANTFGPKGPGTAANGSPPTGVGPWVNPNNIKLDDGSFTTSPVINDAQTAQLLATNFSMGVTPSDANITGIQVDIKGFNPSTTANLVIRLTKAGVPVGYTKILAINQTNSFVTFGGIDSAAGYWGTSFTAADLNDTGFGVDIIGTDVSVTGTSIYSLDYVQITAYISGSSIVLGAPSGTGITLISGREYTVVFQNSLAGTTSTLTPFSASTGPLTNQGQPMSGLPVSGDPQVDTKLLLATADGSDQTTLYLVTTLANATTTYTDTMPDSVLLLQSIYQQTDQNGNLHGVANNNPPPLIDFPIKHKGRIYGLKGSLLAFSKNLDDVTTSSGTITGKWEEAWPATYTLDISELAESGAGLLSDGQTLYIGTDRSIRRLVGDSPDNFQEPEVLFNEAGILNQETWKVVFKEGQPIGSMWLTPDFRVMFSDFNSYQDVGTPINDVLSTINVNAASTCHASFVSKGQADYYMLHLSTGSNTKPNVVCVYNIKYQKWYVWTPTDSITASLFNLNAQGVPQWLFATLAGPLYQWDDTVRKDRTGNTPVSYQASAQSSWLDFGDMGLTKAFNKIIVTTADPILTVGVQGATTDADLDSGGKLVLSATPLQQEIFGDLFVPMVGQDGFYKWYQVTFTSPASTVIDVIDGFDFEIQPSMRM